MRALWAVIAIALLGCDEKNTWEDASDTVGDGPDTVVDTVVDTVDTLEDTDDERRCTTDEDCEDGNVCTHNQCNVEDDRCFWAPYDDDGDGFGPIEREGEHCGGSDCDDSRDDINPDALPGCDDLDHNCDTLPDNDVDLDGHGSEICGGDDCDDGNDHIHPGATEICDTIDQDCDDLLTDAPGADDDGDLHLDEGCGGDDCDDTRSDVYAGAPEVCGDGVDQDCNTIVDDATAPALVDVRVTNDPGSGTESSLVWTGSHYGIAWMDDRDGNQEIYFARVEPGGTLAGSELRVTDAVTASRSPDLAWTGTEYAMAWFDHRDGNEEIYFARMSAAGSKAGGDVTVTINAYTSFEPDIAWSGSEYGIAWRDNRDGNDEIYFTRISDAGAKIGGDRRISNASNSSAFPSLVWTGSEYGVCWHDSRDDSSPTVSPYVYEIYCARILPDGTKNGSDTRMTSSASTSWYPSLHWLGTQYGVSWNDERDGNGEVYLGIMSAAGTKVGPDVRVTNRTGESWRTSLVWSGSDLGVSWDDDRDGNEEIYFNRVILCE
jgi:hypothetical protein